MTAKTGQASLPALALCAVGVVYGDIGTSPLYAVQESFNPVHGIAPVPANVIGVISVMVWTLVMIVAVKYVVLILRADNRGEGGIMALTALASSAVGRSSPRYRTVVILGLVGAALFCGDGVITPSISVLSAVEGLDVATPAFKPYAVPLAVAILTGLYLVQKTGTGRIGFLFAPVLTVWFLVIGAVGLASIVRAPQILAALDPLRAVDFMRRNGMTGFAALGAIVLAVTGAEALYADLGHFGRRAIRTAWFALVFPSLLLNYLGQGALLLTNPAAIDNPFYRLVPVWGVVPMVALATTATVIASQATISGTFSFAKQAIQLGYLPRMRVVQTSEQSLHQVYLPDVNWLQFALVATVTIAFGSSSALAAAYGIAVTGTMLITTLLTFEVLRYGWKYPLWLAVGATGLFLAIDAAFFSANTLRIVQGGWFPLAIAAFVFFIMMTWSHGRRLVQRRLRQDAVPLQVVIDSLVASPPVRVPGTAVFLRGEQEGAPRAFMHNLLHNKVLHERVIFLTAHVADEPWVPERERVKVHPLGHEFYQVDVYWGFMDEPNVPRALELCKSQGLAIDPMQTSYFLSRQRLVPGTGPGRMAGWRERLFAAMVRNAADPADYFKLPSNRVAELGAQIEI
ncbi:MAG TPA: potassium transporter Kup [Burkholderiaceae bacterium]|jgi:KUP system potassium uptake protein|nr:potassium transporter Kup [Burkholderiaceae bacterium]